MRPQRHLPPFRRLVLEYIAMALVYFAAWFISGNLIIALVAMVISVFALRATRPKGGDEPPTPPGSERL